MTEKTVQSPKTLEPDAELQIRYYPDTDTLVLAAVEAPGPFGETVARNLVAMSNHEGEVTAMVLHHAIELLQPYLFPKS